MDIDCSKFFKDNNFEIWTPKALWVSKKEFAQKVFNLIEKSNNINPQITEKSIDELKERYNSSYIIYDRKGDEIIWSSTLEDKEFNIFKKKWVTNKIAMFWWLVVDPEYRWRWFWESLLDQIFKYWKKEKKYLVTYTSNPIVKEKKIKQWFEDWNKSKKSIPLEFIIEDIKKYELKLKEKNPEETKKFLKEVTSLFYKTDNLTNEEKYEIDKIFEEEYVYKEMLATSRPNTELF